MKSVSRKQVRDNLLRVISQKQRFDKKVADITVGELMTYKKVAFWIECQLDVPKIYIPLKKVEGLKKEYLDVCSDSICNGNIYEAFNALYGFLYVGSHNENAPLTYFEKYTIKPHIHNILTIIDQLALEKMAKANKIDIYA